MTTRLGRKLAILINARTNCDKSSNKEWFEKHTEKIERLVRDYLPSGSGFDNGTSIDLHLSTGEKLVFYTAFHHMDENGYYDEWTDHTIVVRPSLSTDFRLSISGKNRNDVKTHIYEIFQDALLCYVE